MRFVKDQVRIISSFTIDYKERHKYVPIDGLISSSLFEVGI